MWPIDDQIDTHDSVLYLTSYTFVNISKNFFNRTELNTLKDLVINDRYDSLNCKST